MISSITNLATLDGADLRQRFIDCELLSIRTEHVGRLNRLSRWKSGVANRLIELGQGSPRELMPLLDHPDDAVRLSAAYAIKPLDSELFVATLQALTEVGGKIGQKARSGLDWFYSQQRLAAAEAQSPALDPQWQPRANWQKDNPPPPALSRAHLEDRIRTRFSEKRAAEIVSLMCPAIGLWPQRSVSPASPLTSHIHGQAWAPPSWEWPLYEEEPLYFLGQIHLPDLAGMPGSELLPPDGILAFFGDFDVIAGCEGEYCYPDQQAVHHWPAAGLRQATPPLPLDHDPTETAETLVALRPFVDLPHPASTIIESLGLNGDEEELYAQLYEEVQYHGIPEDERFYSDVESKLLGWPSLVQSDFDQTPQSGLNPYRLLVQLPARLGPGGSLYFFIRKNDLAVHRFDRCELAEQNT